MDGMDETGHGDDGEVVAAAAAASVVLAVAKEQ